MNPSPSAGGEELVSILRVYNDVTERLKRSHEALAGEVCRLREELHEKNLELARRERLSALGQMAAGVAHEIRNPLGGIGLYASLLERNLEDRPAQRQIARRIGEGVQNVEHIVRDILAFAGGAAPRMNHVPLGRLLDGLIEQVAAHAAAKEVAIEVDASLHDVVLYGDFGQIERALLNLVLNAVEAVEREGRVWIRRGDRVVEGGYVEIVVDDDGGGIAPEAMQKIFNPFFTTKDHGTGLGLAIVHRIAEAHGGTVRSGDRAGGGASLAVTFPLAERNDVEREMVEAGWQGNTGSTSSGPGRESRE